jgi:D-xylose transport system permease protein
MSAVSEPTGGMSPLVGGRNQTISDAISSYRARIAGGDIGILSAVLGFIILLAFFTILEPTTFTSTRNFANLLNQAAGVMFISMGLVFILLLGEIDLSAGYLAGTSSAILGVTLRDGNPWFLALAACLGTGALIGLVNGVLVAYVRIPSFVVTLSGFLALQGVLLAVIGEGGTIRINDSVVLAVSNRNLAPVLGWVLAGVVVLLYVAFGFVGRRRRAAKGLPLSSGAVFWGGAVLLAVVMAVLVYLFNQERAVNVEVSSLKGVPVVVPIAVFFIVFLTFVLTRTSFGRHVFAVGGNAEAARRAGINVAGTRVACFVIGGSMAAVGGIVIASRDNSVSPTTGGDVTLLFAVAAAVIGGTSLFGGRGTIIGAVLGALVVATIRNGLPLIVSKSWVVFVVTGLVLLLAATVDALSRRRGLST